MMNAMTTCRRCGRSVRVPARCVFIDCPRELPACQAHTWRVVWKVVSTALAYVETAGAPLVSWRVKNFGALARPHRTLLFHLHGSKVFHQQIDQFLDLLLLVRIPGVSKIELVSPHRHLA